VKKDIKLKRLNIEIEDEIHAVIKISSAMRGISIKKWVLRAIMKQIELEKTFE
jgi:predicted HicB family RNase H-like nuclease